MTDEGNKKREENLRVFSQAAATYDRIGPRIFSHFGQRLVDIAEIKAAAHVLDVAAGRGAVLFPAAAQVGSTGHVIGIDFSPDMVRETSREIDSAGWRHVQLLQMDAEQMDFPDASFDCVLCGFALWMFAQPSRVLREFERVLRCNGRIAVSTWDAGNPFQAWCHELLRPFAATRGAQVAPLKPESNFDTPSELEAGLHQAGFTAIKVTAEEQEFVYADEQEFWLSLWSSGIRRQLEKMSPAVLKQAKKEVFKQLQAFRKADGFYKVNRVLFAIGTKPAL